MSAEELLEDIRTKVEAENLICDEVNDKIKELEAILAASSLKRLEFTVSQIWGTNIFYVFWCPSRKRLCAFTEDMSAPLLEHPKTVRKEFFRKWEEFLTLVYEAL